MPTRLYSLLFLPVRAGESKPSMTSRCTGKWVGPGLRVLALSNAVFNVVTTFSFFYAIRDYLPRLEETTSPPTLLERMQA